MFCLPQLKINHQSPRPLQSKLTTKLTVVSFLCMSVLSTGSALATNANTSANTDIFDTEFYLKFAPQTLYDMLQNTPDANSVLVELEHASQNRGFGSAGEQILINNQRLSGKENSIDKELENIQARDVKYIEVIRGTHSDLAVQSKGIVVNVVLKETSKSALLWTLGAEKIEHQSPILIGSALFSAREGNLKYRVGLVQEASPFTVERFEQHTLANSQHSLNAQYLEKRDLTRRRTNGKLEYQLSNSIDLQLNALYEKYYMDKSIDKQTDYLITSTTKYDTTLFDYDRDKWELGGDVNVKIADNNQVRFLFISNETDAHESVWFNSAPIKQEQKLIYQLPREYTASENILRSNWKYSLSSSHSFDSGFEVAINKRNEGLNLFRPTTAYHSVENNNIKETRYEAFVNYNFAISHALNLQTSLIYEKSTMAVDTKIDVRSDTVNQVQDSSSRSFNYLKPRVNMRYDFNSIYQIRFNYERSVSQLSLHDFVPWYNQFEQRLEPVNPNLEPEVKEEFSVTLEKKWQATNGSISLTPYYHDISDLITEIPLGDRSGDGNVDEAKEYGLKLKTNFGLDYFGFSNTLISASYTWRDSEMISPFTKQVSPIERTSKQLWNVKINQNDVLPGLSISASLTNKTPYLFNYYSYQGRLTSDLTLNAYLDYKINDQLKLRLTGAELLKRKYKVFKQRHSANFAESKFLRHEVRDNAFSPEVALTLTGQF